MAVIGPVVLFCGDLGGTGVARNTVRAAKALRARGLPVAVISTEAGVLARELAGLPLTVLDPALRKPRSLALASCVPQLRRKLEQLSPALVISMGNHAHLASWAALRGMDQVNRVYRISNDLAHSRPASFGSLCRRLSSRVVSADADRVICVSQALAESAPFAAAREQGRLVVLSNGVDVARVRAAAAEPPALALASPETPLVVAIGRVHPQKNYPALLKALALCRAHGRELRAAIVGRDNGVGRAELEALAQRLGVADLVCFTGELANPFPLVRQAQVFALLSRWEGSPNSLLEALACGTPVVASRTAGAAAEILDGGAYGRLVDPEDPAEIAAALVAQADGGAECVRPGDRAEAFDAPRASQAFVAEMLPLLAPRPHRGWAPALS